MRVSFGYKLVAIFSFFLVILALASCAQTSSVGSGLSADAGDQIVMAKAGGAGGSLPSMEGYEAVKDVQDVYFAFDKAILNDASISALIRNAEWFKKNQSAMILIEGHADERGTNEYNLALGERRAKTAKDFLASLGISHSRINQVSYGEERPVCKESTEECWSKNRRDHFLVKMK